MKPRWIAALVSLFVVTIFLSCSGDPNGPGMGRVSVLLTDDPADFDAVNLVVREVAIHHANAGVRDDDEDDMDDDDGEADDDSTDVDDDSTDVEDDVFGSSGWEVLNGTPQTLDLLLLRDGVTTKLAVGTVPAGRYTQVRLLLGEGSNVVVDGVTHSLQVPSGLQTGLKLVGGFTVPEGEEIELTVDIDAAQSVLLMPDGSYRLSPTAKLMQ